MNNLSIRDLAIKAVFLLIFCRFQLNLSSRWNVYIPVGMRWDGTKMTGWSAGNRDDEDEEDVKSHHRNVDKVVVSKEIYLSNIILLPRCFCFNIICSLSTCSGK